MNDFRQIFDRLKLIYGVNTDKKVSEELGINYNTVKTWSSRGKIPIETLLQSIQNESLNISWLLTGKGSMYLSDTTSQSSHNTVGDNSIVVNGNGNINIAIKKEDFKDDSEDIKHLVSLLKYAPKSFIKQIIDRLQKFKELSQF